MSSNSQQPHHRGWFSEETFNHRHHKDGANEVHAQESHVQDKESPKKESEIHRLVDELKKSERGFKDYIHKDEQLDEDGGTYGGLM